jgi:predicted RNA-binding Zn-ribbon protein involved in translation (DUF1610 family)
MGKFDNGPLVPRQSFSHARVKPVMVANVKRSATAGLGKQALICPSCGRKMKLVRSKSKGQPNLTVSCPQCSGAMLESDS